jgi:GAF domain-containing protein/anti-sigma regulatory factor (Ser/Thr protein kinase)
MEMLILDIKEPGNRRETQKCIMKAAQDLLSAEWCAIVTLNPITQQFYGRVVTTGELRERDVKAVQSWLEGNAIEVIKSKELYITEPLGLPEVLIEGFNIKDTSSFRVVTLSTKRERRPMAILFIGFRQSRLLNSEEEASLGMLISQSSLILENTWLLGRYRAVIDIGQKLNRKLSGYRDLFEKLREEVASIIDTSYFFMMAVYQPQSNTLDRYFSLEQGRPVVQLRMELEGACERVINKARPLKSSNLSQDIDWDVNHVDLIGNRKPNSESVIFEPLLYRGEVLGVLTVQHPDIHAFDEEDVRIMKLLGNQVALALSNFRLFKYLETLNDIGQRLTENLDSDDLLNDVAKELRKSTNADIVTLYPYLPSEDRFGQPIFQGTLRRPEFLRPKIRTDNIAWLTLKKGEPVWAKNSTQLYKALGGDTKKREGNFEEREEIRSTAAISLQIGNEAIGVLFVNFRVVQRFPAAQKNLILGLANYAAIAIKNYRKYTAANQRRFDDLVTLQKIDRKMRQTPKLKEVLYAILDGAAGRIPAADESAILLYNHRTEQLETAAAIGTNSKAYENLTLPVNNGKGITVWVYKNKMPRRVDNVDIDSELQDVYYPVISDTISELDFPLIDENEVVGVISFESKKEKAFTREDEEFISTLAGQAVLAIKSAQLYEMVESSRQELETLHEVAQEIIIQEGDPERVMQLILKKARELLVAEMGALQLYEGTRPSKVYVSDSNNPDGEPFIETVDPGDTDKRVVLGIVQHVAETRMAYITKGDAVEDPYYKGSHDYHSEIAVPLISQRGELIGVLDLESPRLYAFDNDDLEVLDAFARQAVIAIQYAQVYILARAESERFRLLSEAGRDLGELTDIEQITQAYKIILRKVSEFNDGEILVRRFDEVSQELVLAQVLNPRRVPPPDKIPISQGINGQVARERRTIMVHDIKNIPPGVVQPFGDDPSIRTLAITPIQFQRTRYYGNLVLSHAKASSLSRADISLLEGLAQQLAITIHRLEMVQAKMEADEQAKYLEFVGELGQSTMEIAHRLTNELGLINFYASNIRQAISRSGIESSIINEELDRVIRDVSNVLNMSKGLKQKVSEIGEEGRFKQGQVPLPVTALLEDSSWTLPLPENVRLTWDLADDLGNVNVVAGQIVDILRNLVANAIEVMPDGGSITIRAFNAPPYIQIEVEDTGPGISIEYQPKIFNLFFSTKKSSGFGLWSARRYARANGGELTMKSDPGKGTTFVLTLPIAERGSGVST